MKGSYKGFSLFTEVDNPILKAWNIYSTMKNIKEIHGSVVMERYFEQIDERTRGSVAIVSGVVHHKGEEYVKRYINIHT